MAGFGAPRRGPRLPPSVLLALLAVIGLLAFNYWSVSSRRAALALEVGALQAQAERAEVARLRLERRNSELVLLAEERRVEERRQRDQRGGLEERLRGTEERLRGCRDRQVGMQNNMSHLMLDIARLKEQLADLNQAFLQREDQLHDLQTNNTYLLNRLEQESLQCGKRIKELKMQYEENAKKMPELDDPVLPEEPVGQMESSKENWPDLDEMSKKEPAKDAVESLTVMAEETSKVNLQNLKEPVKAGEGDAGMPELEENGATKLEDLPTALKSPLLFGPEAVLNLPSIRPQDFDLVPDAEVALELKSEDTKPPRLPRVQPLEMQKKLHVESSLKGFIPRKRSTNLHNPKQNDEERDAQEDPADYRKDHTNDVL